MPKLSDTHTRVFSLLPWHVNNTLTREDRTLAEAHLAECAHCRAELARHQSLATDIRQQLAQTSWQPSLAKFNRLMDKIEQGDSTAVQTGNSIRPTAPSLVKRLKSWFTELSDSAPSVRWTMVAQGSLVVVLAVTLVVINVNPQEQKLYQTVTTPSTQPPLAGHIHLVVDEAMPVMELRALLNSINGTIVQGPGTLGIYTIALADSKTLDTALRTLRSNSRVKLAEPVVQ